MVFTKSATKLQKVFQNTIFFTKKLYVFAKDFVILDSKDIIARKIMLLCLVTVINNRYDLSEKCIILI